MDNVKVVLLLVLIAILNLKCASDNQSIRLTNSETELFLDKSGIHSNYLINLSGAAKDEESNRYCLKVTDTKNNSIVSIQNLNVKILKRHTAGTHSNKIRNKFKLVTDTSPEIKVEDDHSNSFILHKLNAGFYKYFLEFDFNDERIEIEFSNVVASQSSYSSRDSQWLKWK